MPVSDLLYEARQCYAGLTSDFTVKLTDPSVWWRILHRRARALQVFDIAKFAGNDVSVFGSIQIPEINNDNNDLDSQIGPLLGLLALRYVKSEGHDEDPINEQRYGKEWTLSNHITSTARRLSIAKQDANL